jgi:hypothetical protein
MQRATVQSTAAGNPVCHARALRQKRWHCSRRLPTLLLKTAAWRKPQCANGGCVRIRWSRSVTTPSHSSRSDHMKALQFICPPSPRFVLPPSASQLYLPQRHLLLIRLHSLQRLPGGHAPQRHQQRERRRHQHNRHLELGRVQHPLVNVGEHVVA